MSQQFEWDAPKAADNLKKHLVQGGRRKTTERSRRKAG
jgi:uncharacterized DUF497 family protein